MLFAKKVFDLYNMQEQIHKMHANIHFSTYVNKNFSYSVINTMDTFFYKISSGQIIDEQALMESIKLCKKDESLHDFKQNIDYIIKLADHIIHNIEV